MVRPIGKACLVVAALLVLGGPALAQVAPGEVVAEIRVHGNYATADAEVARLAGVAVGQPVDAGLVPTVQARLERTGRFIAVDVRQRYRSFDGGGDVALIIIVQEYPIPDAAPSPIRPIRRTLGSAMFMPILNYADGYGLTYGARITFVDGIGKSARLSIPLTWGGTKRVAAEFEKSIGGGIVDRITASASLSRRTNPFYRIDDDRREASIGASRAIAGPLRLAGRFGVSSVTFGAGKDRYPFIGADLTLDTRIDPVFPRNAVLASAGWDRLAFRETPPANRVRLDARGYLGLIGQSVVSVRAQYATADRPLPAQERFLVGGAGILRGYRAGSFSGDGMAATSVELRVPISSPLSFARTGVTLFLDRAAVFESGAGVRGASWEQGYGGGVFLLASIFQLNADVAVGRDGHLRLHVVSGFQF